jgi:sugar (pentulose or hexulose) kinase
MYHPYIDPAGERAPFVAPDARAQFTGLSVHHSRADLLAAVYEGVVLAALDCYTLMPIPVGELKLAGGGARSALWAQMFANALGCPVTVAEGREFGAKGAALTAGLAVGRFASYEAAVAATVRPARRYEPDLPMRDRYAVLLRIYRAVRDVMLPVWEERARLLAELKEWRETRPCELP